MKRLLLTINVVFLLISAKVTAQIHPKILQAAGPSISASGVAGYISACEGAPSASPHLERFRVSGTGLTGAITIAAPADFELSLSPASGYTSTLILPSSGGAVGGIMVFVCGAAASHTGDISGDVMITSPGAAAVSVAVSGIINLLPVLDGVPSKAFANGQIVPAIDFNAPFMQVKWTNNNTAIGLPASGTGDLPSFTATDAGTTPITANIMATPLELPFACVPNQGDGTVSIVNVVDHSVLKTIPVGLNPIGVAVSPNGLNVYIANSGSNTVSVINTWSYTVTATVDVGGDPNGIVMAPQGDYVYVASENSKTISVIDTKTNRVVKTISLTEVPYGIAIDPFGSYAYVTNYAANSVSVVDLNAGQVIMTIGVGLFPVGVAANPASSEVYVTNQNSNSVSVINTTTNQVDDVIGVGATPTGIAFSPDGTKAYVCNASSHSVSVIDAATRKVIHTFSMSNADALPYGISVSPDGGEIYVADEKSGLLTIMDASSGTITGTVAVGQNPYAFGSFAALTALCSGDPVSFTITVNPASPLSWSGNLQALTTTYGTPSAAGTFTVSGLGLSGDVTVTAPPGFEVSTDGNTFAATVNLPNSGALTSVPVYIRLAAATPVGNYAGNIVLSTPGQADVDVPATESKVTPATLTVIADDKVKTYGQPNPELTLSYSGFVNGEDIARLTVLPVASTNATISSLPGKYLITAGGGSAPNYNFSYIPGILTIYADGRAITPPTAFTPNADGVNDTWDIQNINFYLNCTVNIYNRYGEKVYSSIGYGVPWDGTYKGKYLPAGPYYYVIDLNEGNNNVYSGCVTIIR